VAIKYFDRRIAWIIFFFLIAAVLSFANRTVILFDNHEVGDFAANSLLVLDAKSFNLWVGNYSRVGFNHPGPAILFVLAAGEIVFHDLAGLVKSPFSGQLIAVSFYSAFWICLLASLFLRMLSSATAAALTLAVFLFATAFIDYQFFNGIWFPHLYFFPFAVVLLSLARLAEGKTDALIFLAISTGFLINGHVSFVAMLGIMLLCVLFFNFISQKGNASAQVLNKQFRHENRQIILKSAGIIVLFLLPLLIMTIKNFPGPIAEYARYGGHRKSNAIVDAVKFVSVYWGGLVPMLIGMLICLALLFYKKASAESLRVRGMAAALLSATAALIFYAKFGVDLLDQTYIGLFYYAVPALLLATLVSIVVSVSQSLIVKAISVVVSLVLLAGGFQKIQKEPEYLSLYSQPYINDLYNAMNAHKTNGRLVLDLDNVHEWGYIWTTMAGAEAQAKRAGNDLFCINQNWHILFTKHAHCSEEEILSGNRFFVSKRTNEALTPLDFQGAELLFQHYSPPDLGKSGLVSIRDNPKIFQTYLLGPGWSGVASDFVLTEGRKALLRVPIPQGFRGGAISIDFGAFLPSQNSVQDIKIFSDSKLVKTARFISNNNRQKISIPVAAGSANVLLQIVIERPVSPVTAGISKDSRLLGVSLYSLKLEEN